MMDKLIEKFVDQLEEAIDIGERSVINTHTVKIHNVFVSGLGGSGIGGNFVQEFVNDELKVPMMVRKRYFIPSFVGKHTLAICSSYSGNTEETLSAFDQIEKTGAKIICISSGGKLIDLAKSKGLDYIQVPDNWPSPRACLGYSVVLQLYALIKLDLISDRCIQDFKSAINLLKFDQEEIKFKAKRIAGVLSDKMPVIYIEDRMESVAVRLRQQINENAKMLCWHHVIPEMNHNELVGWRNHDPRLAVLFFRSKDDYRRNQTRMDINKEIISKYTDTIIEIYSKGNSHIEKALYFVNLGDWVSWYMSEIRKVDSIEVKVIDYLKGQLAQV